MVHGIYTRSAGLVLVFAVLIGTAMAQEAPSATNCGTSDSPLQQFRLSWLQVPSDTSLATLVGGRVDLVATNGTDTTVRARVTLLVDAGSARKRAVALPELTIRRGERRVVPIGLQSLGVSLQDMRFSGMVLASAEVVPAGHREDDGHGKPNPRGAPADTEVRRHGSGHGPRGDGVDPRAFPGPLPPPPVNPVDVFAGELYFHRPAPGAPILAYGAEVLRSRFRAGDLSGRIHPPSPDIALQRVVAGGGGHFEPLRSREARIRALGDEARVGGSPNGPPPAIGTADRRVCIKWEISLADKGKLLQTGGGALIREDHWSGGAGDPTGDLASPGDAPATLTVTARGVRVTLVDGAWQQNFDADPATGCFVFSRNIVGQMEMYVWGYSTDADDNVITAAQPFGVFDAPFVWGEIVDPPPVGQQRTYYFGDYSSRATLAATGAFASYRAHYGLSDKEIHIIEDSTCPVPGGNNSSAHFDPAPAFAQGLARIRIHSGQGSCAGSSCDGCMGAACACDPNDHRRWKFVITHEMGHAWMLLATGLNRYEPNVATDLVDTDETECGTGGGYGIDTLEWNSLGAREGMAHFYATEVFNFHGSGTAVFTWFGSPMDVEYNNPHEDGGRLFNNCTTSERCGKATNIDWLRMFWDWHTPFEPGDKPSINTMRAVYAAAAGDDGLLKNNYYLKFREAVDNEVATLAFRDAWDDAAAWNGTDTNPNGEIAGSSCGSFGYPDCVCWSDRAEPIPEECIGTPGCACADIDPPLNTLPEQFDQEGLFPDGAGSYLLHGTMNGPGQHCFDASIGLPEGAGVCGIASFGALEFPVCHVCGVDTQLGCPCEVDGDCGGLDSGELACWGSSDQGWAGNGIGTCLPSSASALGRDELEELQWFCLDSCPAKGNHYRCVYDQLRNTPPGIELPHAQCLDITCSSPVGFCEALPQAAFCDVNASCAGIDEDDWIDCCIGECFSQDDCAAIGFPDHYECDFLSIGTSYGHCVPPECAIEDFFNGNQNYCFMFW